MKPLNSLLIILASCLSIHSNAQIKLSGYRCKYYPDQTPNTMAEMCGKNDTFRFTLFSRDIWAEMWNETGSEQEDPKKELKIGLDLCFDNDRYIITKDSLYIATGKYQDVNAYYYRIYDPKHMSSISLRSNKSDSVFSQKSKWLLSQIRLHRNGDIYLLNDRGQTCQNPFDDERVK